MTFANPYALLLMLPALLFLGWLKSRSGDVTARLPGHWRRAIAPAMQPFMAGRTADSGRLPWVTWMVLWILLVLALAGPAIDSGKPTAFGNLAGRVIAVDLGAGIDIHSQRLAVNRLLDAAPAVPTAVIVATADAYDVVPLTTDRAHLDRYLQVIDFDMMPELGRAPVLTLSHAEAILTRAGIVAGQVILVTGGTPPALRDPPESNWLRAVVLESDTTDAWRGTADALNAELSDANNITPLIDALNEEIASAVRNSDEAALYSLMPWFVGAALAMWLLFFRRRRLL